MTATLLSQNTNNGHLTSKRSTVPDSENGDSGPFVPKSASATASDVGTIYFKYDDVIEIEIDRLDEAIRSVPAPAALFNPRWLAIQLLEGDEALIAKVRGLDGGQGSRPVDHKQS